MLEEFWRRAIQQRPPETFTAANDVDEMAILQRLQDTTRTHATNFFDLITTDRLAVRNYRKNFQRRRRQARLLRNGIESFEVGRELRPRHQLVAAGNVYDRECALLRFVFFTQLRNHRFDRVLVETFVDERNVAGAQRRVTGE